MIRAAHEKKCCDKYDSAANPVPLWRLISPLVRLDRRSLFEAVADLSEAFACGRGVVALQFDQVILAFDRAAGSTGGLHLREQGRQIVGGRRQSGNDGRGPSTFTFFGTNDRSLFFGSDSFRFDPTKSFRRVFFCWRALASRLHLATQVTRRRNVKLSASEKSGHVAIPKPAWGCSMIPVVRTTGNVSLQPRSRNRRETSIELLRSETRQEFRECWKTKVLATSATGGFVSN